MRAVRADLRRRPPVRCLRGWGCRRLHPLRPVLLQAAGGNAHRLPRPGAEGPRRVPSSKHLKRHPSKKSRRAEEDGSERVRCRLPERSPASTCSHMFFHKTKLPNLMTTAAPSPPALPTWTTQTKTPSAKKMLPSLTDRLTVFELQACSYNRPRRTSSPGSKNPKFSGDLTLCADRGETAGVRHKSGGPVTRGDGFRALIQRVS